MLDSIFIGMSGLMGYSRGLRVIANNTANINTPGFKGASLQFGDLFYSNGSAGGAFSGSGIDQTGQGLTTYSTTFDFSQGELRQSGNDLDLAVDGQGLFTLKDKDGTLRYTRDGEFKFDDDGFLVSRTNGAKVMGYDEHGALVEVNLNDLRTNTPQATSKVTFRDNLAFSSSDASLGSHKLDVQVRDSSGAVHLLTVDFKQAGLPKAGQTSWNVTVKDGNKNVGSGQLDFLPNGDVDPEHSKIAISYTPEGMAAFSFDLDFSDGVHCFSDSNGADTLQMTATDGFVAGTLTQATFDADGVLNLKYSNGQTTKGVALALARFNSPDNVVAIGDNLFEPVDMSTWETGSAQKGAFGTLRSGVVEISNVDLSSEFSDLVIMQRGYQASSQVVSTANEMIQELFSLKGR